MGWMDDRDIDAILAENKRLKKKDEDEKQVAQSRMRELLTVGEIGVTTLGISYANARYAPNGEYTVMNVPVDLAAAVLLFAVGMFVPQVKKYRSDVMNVGTGSLSAYLARLGTNLGNTQKAGAASAPAAAGLFGTGAIAGSPYGAQRFAVPTR